MHGKSRELEPSPCSAKVPLMFARIVLDLPIAMPFDFRADGLTRADIGRLVEVPFGAGKRRAQRSETGSGVDVQQGEAPHAATQIGLIIDVLEATDVPVAKLKSIVGLVPFAEAFTAADMALFQFCERYYHHPIGQIALSAIPPLLKLGARRARRTSQPRVIALTDDGLAAIETISARAVAQRAMLETLARGPIAERELKQRHARAATTLSQLLKKSWAMVREDVAPNTALKKRADDGFSSPHALNAEQQQAVSAINAAHATFTPFLLAGITGSGKTEVYLHAIHHCLLQDRQALVLVPEINLTPAFVRAVCQRFAHAKVVELHSGMAEVPRLDAWLSAQRGEADILIGTRLAVFAPLPRLGLIVVDEEHDGSFKQQEGFRYSARDVAVFRASDVRCPVALGSATPSLESLQNVAQARFTPLSLTERAAAQAALPVIDFIDLNVTRAPDGISERLLLAIGETVARGEQALVFINRRGFAPALVCGQCAWMPECTRCTARMVFHRGAGKSSGQLKCHHCGGQRRVPVSCQDCGSQELVAAGIGTERVEEALLAALASTLPSARIVRVDRDSTRRRGAAEKIFSAAAKGEIDVLIGTQMLAKGHDFPKLTLVGVVNADSGMFSADFRAAERLAAQLMQVAGRAGRANLSGRVLVQTRFQMHPLYQAVATHDYAAFARIALAERQHAHLPPFSFLALLRAEARNKEALAEFMLKAAQSAHSTAQTHEVTVWDPVPPTLARKAGYERRQLMIQAPTRRALQNFLSDWLLIVRAQKMGTVKWVIDVDPHDV
jgi:primosomal protein N' (replication factor Y) (superfamily II helicase)